MTNGAYISSSMSTSICKLCHLRNKLRYHIWPILRRSTILALKNIINKYNNTINKQQMLPFSLSSSFALAGFVASQRLLLTTSSTGPAIIHAQPCRYHPSELSVRFRHWYPVISQGSVQSPQKNRLRHFPLRNTTNLNPIQAAAVGSWSFCPCLMKAMKSKDPGNPSWKQRIMWCKVNDTVALDSNTESAITWSFFLFHPIPAISRGPRGRTPVASWNLASLPQCEAPANDSANLSTFNFWRCSDEAQIVEYKSSQVQIAVGFLRNMLEAAIPQTCLIAIPQDAHVILSHQLASLTGIVGVENGPHHGHGCLGWLDVRQVWWELKTK